MTIDPFGLFLPIPRPKRPEDKIGPIRRRKQRESINSPMFADPVPGLDMIRMSAFGESGRLGLLRRKEALLLIGEIEEPTRRFSVRVGHDTILQLFCSYRILPSPTLTIHVCKNEQKVAILVQI